MLQMGSGLSDVACALETTPANALRMGTFDPCPRRILLTERVCGLPLTRGLQRLVLLPRLEAEETRFLLGSGTLRSLETGRTVFTRKAHFPCHAALRIRVGKPGNALLAHRAGDDLLLPIDQELRLIKAGASTRLPTRVIGDRANQGHAIAFAAAIANRSRGGGMVTPTVT